MPHRLAPFWVACLIFTCASAQPRLLVARLVNTSMRPAAPVAKATVTLLNTSQETITDENGRFQFSLPASLPPGSEVQIAIKAGNLRIYLPSNGVLTVSASGARPLEIQLLPAGSKLFLEPAAIEALLAQAAKPPLVAERRNSEQQEESQPRLRRFLEQWAVNYGFGLEDVEREVKAWGDQVRANREKASVRQRALAEFQAQRFAEAAALFEESATAEAAALDQAEREEKAVLRRYLDDKIRGSEALTQSLKFAAAAQALEAAAKRVDRGRYPEWWAELQSRWAISLGLLGSYGEAGQSIPSLRISIAASDGALLVWTKPSAPQKWALCQSIQGAVYVALGRRLAGIEGMSSLQAAVACFRNALQIYTREASPENWAMSQVDLGVAYDSIGLRLRGSEAIENLRVAESSYQNALQVYTRQSFPDDWASAQSSLGGTCARLSGLLSGKDATETLVAALTHYSNALEVRTKESQPREWARTLNNLGNAYQTLTDNPVWTDPVKSLLAAVNAYQHALEVRTKDSLPQEWASTQYNLANAQRKLGEKVGGPDSIECLRNAVSAYRSALQVRTKEALPMEWAQTQDNLGIAHWDLGERLDGAEAVEALRASVSAYQNALTFRTRTVSPEGWARLQHNLGLAYRSLGERLTGPEASDSLIASVTAFQNALRIRTREAYPDDWGTTKDHLARTLMLQQQWEPAAQAAEDSLIIYPKYVDGLARAHWLYHEKLFRYDRAFELAARRVELGDGEVDYVETHLTTGRFDACSARAAAIDAKISAKDQRQALAAIRFACLSAAQKSDEALAAGHALRRELAGLAKANWLFSGTKHFLASSPAFASQASVWVSFFDALEQGDESKALASLAALGIAQ